MQHLHNIAPIWTIVYVAAACAEGEFTKTKFSNSKKLLLSLPRSARRVGDLQIVTGVGIKFCVSSGNQDDDERSAL